MRLAVSAATSVPSCHFWNYFSVDLMLMTCNCKLMNFYVDWILMTLIVRVGINVSAYFDSSIFSARFCVLPLIRDLNRFYSKSSSRSRQTLCMLHVRNFSPFQMLRLQLVACRYVLVCVSMHYTHFVCLNVLECFVLRKCL